MPKIRQSTTETTVTQDGELVERRTNQTLSWGAEPSYIKLYLQDILFLTDIPCKHEKVLYELLKKASYAGADNGMEVVVNASLKRRIAKSLGMKNEGSISNAITDLVKGKVLYRVETGIYKFNPWLFGKGDWQDVAKLRLEVSYDDIKGKTFKAVCEYKPNTDSHGEAPLEGQISTAELATA